MERECCRRYFIGYRNLKLKEVPKETFMKCIKNITKQEYKTLIKGEILWRDNVCFYIENECKVVENKEVIKRQHDMMLRRQRHNIKRRRIKNMSVKDLLSKYNGEFYIYEKTYDEHENLIKNGFIANYKDFAKHNKYIDKIKERSVHSFEVKKSSLNIYLVSKRKTTDNIMDEHVDFLELPTSIINALVRAKINTIGELCDKTYLDIYAIRNIGEISFKEIVAAMKVYNLCFKKEN